MDHELPVPTGSLRFSRLLILDDFFRSHVNSLYLHSENRRLLYRTFRLHARRMELPCHEFWPIHEGGSLDVGAMMAVLGLPCSLEAWAQTTGADLTPLTRTGLLPRIERDTLVVGWGLPPSILNWVDDCGGAFLDIEVDPIRFASHLSFCARTNDAQILAALRTRAVDDDTHWNDATLLQGFFARRDASHLFFPGLSVGLFCGQTQVDLALVHEGRCIRPIDRFEQIHALADTVDVLVIKPHPYEKNLQHLTELATRIPNATWTDANIYAMLCTDNLEFICGLSSGALREAKYFLKPATALIEPDRNCSVCLPDTCSPWVTVGADILSLACLSEFCDPAAKTTSERRHPPPFAADTLDRIFGSRWGLDTQSPGLQTLPPMVPRHHYLIAQGCPEVAWLTFGWAAPGPDGAWMATPCSSLLIPLPREGWPSDGSDWTLRIEGRRQCLKDGELRARIVGQDAETAKLDAQGDGVRLHFDLPAHAINTDRANVLIVEFDFHGPGQPDFCLCGATLLPASALLLPPPPAPGPAQAHAHAQASDATSRFPWLRSQLRRMLANHPGFGRIARALRASLRARKSP